MYISIKKEISKIFTKLDKIAKEGRDNYQEYYEYVDDLISKGKYAILTQVLLIKYDFDCTNQYSIDDVKRKSWESILYRTNSEFQDKKYKLLKDNSLYQIGLTYYKIMATYSLQLGDIMEQEIYIESIDNKLSQEEFEILTKNKRIYLEVDRFNSTQSSTFSTWNESYTYDKNLLNLYTEAIDYLL